MVETRSCRSASNGCTFFNKDDPLPLRVWGKTFKPALLKELKRLGVKVYDYTEATALLTANVDGKKRGVGAIGMDTHTGKIKVFHSKSTILTMSRPARLWG